MANYLHIPSGQYPIAERYIRTAFQNTSFPQPFVPPDGYALVFPTPQPAFDPVTQTVREIAPVLTDKGHYEQAWEVVALDAETVAANQARVAEALQASIVEQTQARLDEFAQTRNYDGILSAATYASSTVPKFQAEGQYAVEARDATWAKLYEILNDVLAGNRPMPAGFEEIEPELPVLEWPL